MKLEVGGPSENGSNHSRMKKRRRYNMYEPSKINGLINCRWKESRKSSWNRLRAIKFVNSCRTFVKVEEGRDAFESRAACDANPSVKPCESTVARFQNFQPKDTHITRNGLWVQKPLHLNWGRMLSANAQSQVRFCVFSSKGPWSGTNARIKPTTPEEGICENWTRTLC